MNCKDSLLVMLSRKVSKEVTELHHFTKVENLISILESGEFYHSFCLEQTDFLSVKNDSLKEMAFAMVCFADVLESEKSRFEKQFKADSYIIMDKNWAISKGVAPVMYSANNCMSSAALSILLENFAYMRQNGLNALKHDFIKSFEAASSALNIIIGYAKKYQGNYFLERDDKCERLIFTTDETLFFLEREWRHIPLVKDGESYFINREQFKDVAFVEYEKQKLKKYALPFTKNDIVKIFAPSEYRQELIDILVNKYSCSLDEVNKLMC